MRRRAAPPADHVSGAEVKFRRERVENRVSGTFTKRDSHDGVRDRGPQNYIRDQTRPGYILETHHPGYCALRHIATGSSVKIKRLSKLSLDNAQSPIRRIIKCHIFDCLNNYKIPNVHTADILVENINKFYLRRNAIFLYFLRSPACRHIVV